MPALAPAALSAAQVAGLDDPHLITQCELEGRQADGTRCIGLGLAGMYCAACAITIEDALKKVDGVREVQVQATSQRARIVLDPERASLSHLVAAVQSVGYRAWPDAAARAGNERLKERRALLWRLSVAAFCMMQVMMITWPQYVAGAGEIPPDLWQLMNWACWALSLPVVVFSCGPFIRGAWHAAWQGRVVMDTPVALGIVAMFGVSSAVTFGADPDIYGADAYFDSLTMFVTFLLTGRWLESRARERATHSLESLYTRLPEAVERAVAGANPHDLSQAESESVPISALHHGDLVRIPVGQAFPGDGVIVWGRTEVDEAMLTGESRPVPRESGQVVVAGSINLGASVWLSIERLGEDTRYQKIVSLVHQALTEKPGWMRTADRFASPFLWAVIGLALLGALAWQWVDPSRSIWVAVSVLIVTCPCAFSLSGPSGLLAAANAMAKRGVLARRLDAIEALAHVDEVVFDKTGTLTEGELNLQSGVDWSCAAGQAHTMDLSPAQMQMHALWPLALSLARHSQHPLSRSLVHQALLADRADEADVPDSSQPSLTAAPSAELVATLAHSPWLDVRELAGKGVQAQDAQGVLWRLGSAAWALGEAAAQLDEASTQARVWLAMWPQDAAGATIPSGPRQALGFVFEEAFRPEAGQALQQLRDLGLSSSILSGDRRDRVEAAVQVLGGPEFISVLASQASPEDKLSYIAQRQALGKRVVVVGDGINDAPVLAKAHVSVALDQGAALAQSQADVLVLGGRLTGLPQAIGISRKAVRIVRQNLLWAASYNFICIPLALVGWMPPWLAGLGMALSSLGVLLNSLRLSAPAAHS